jgi:hypothetical protein
MYLSTNLLYSDPILIAVPAKYSPGVFILYGFHSSNKTTLLTSMYYNSSSTILGKLYELGVILVGFKGLTVVTMKHTFV